MGLAEVNNILNSVATDKHNCKEMKHSSIFVQSNLEVNTIKTSRSIVRFKNVIFRTLVICDIQQLLTGNTKIITC